MRLARLGFVPVLGFLPLLGFGCSDPAPPTPRGAFSMNFVDPGASCNAGNHSAMLGDVTAARRLRVLTDGEEGATIDCSVTGSGTFKVSAQARNPATAAEIRVNIPAITPAATEEMPATGSISFSSVKTGGETFVSDPAAPCEFWFVPESEQGVNAGEIWVVFECLAMLNDGYSCELRRGALAFDGCGS
ncbi:hypothetical protein WME76_29630 [Sorangium sp. So ce119]|uniref:hypothetical protein n=1 Tax=Sorangium sp. So ce119 TaxID=3133279 RepID=UPI003F6160E7